MSNRPPRTCTKVLDATAFTEAAYARYAASNCDEALGPDVHDAALVEMDAYLEVGDVTAAAECRAMADLFRFKLRG